MTTAELIRAEIIDDIVGYLRSGTNVNVRGMRSSGRSMIVRGVTQGLARDGVTIVRISGIRALRERSLGAIAVAGIDMTPSPNSVQMLMSAAIDLEDSLSSPGAVLVVDDADDLDTASVGAIAAVHARLHRPILTTTRPAGHRQSESATLTAELQPGVRVDLPPLRFDEVHQLVHELLGGPVEPTVIARVAAKSGGLPGLVTAMVATARKASRIAPRGGLWVARGDLWTTPLAQAVEPLLADLDAASIDALTLLSGAGTISIDLAQELISSAALAQLDEIGLIRVLPGDSGTVVDVFPPLVAEYLTHEGSTIRGILFGRQLSSVDHLEIAAPTHESRPMGPRGGESTLSRRVTRHWLDQVCDRRRIWTANPTPANAVPVIEAMLISTARQHEIDGILAGTDPSGADQHSHAIFIAWEAIYLGIYRRQITTARELLSEHRPLLPRLDGLLRATEAHLQIFYESIPDSTMLAEPGDDEDQLAKDAMVLVQAEAKVSSGQAYEALHLLHGFSPASPSLSQSAEVIRELALLYTCDFDTSVSTALANVERCRIAKDPGGIQAHAYVAGLGLAYQGKLIELEDLVSSVLALAPLPAHQLHFQVGLLSLAADAAKWQGRVGYARSLAIQTSALGVPRGPHPGMACDGVPAQVRESDDDATADEIWTLAAERLDSGFLPAGIIAGVSAIERKPDAARAARLLDAARSCDSPLLSHLGAYAMAIAEGNPSQLTAMEIPLRQAGLRLYAVRTAVTRSMSMLTSGDVVGAAEQADSAWHQAGLRGRDLCGLFRRFDRAVNLTAREREIAVLVARGMSAQEIAAEKVLSIRTVENHIFSACRKAGVANREGLAHAAQTWLSCAAD